MHLQRNAATSRLVRLLDDLVGPEADSPRQDFTERQSQWLTALDTIKLDAALHSIKAQASQAPWRARSVSPGSLQACLQGVRAELVEGIHASHRAMLARLLAPMVPAQAKSIKGMDADYVPVYQCHLEQQRHMELKVGQLRALVRQGLSSASPKLRQLAALDAVLENVQAGREQKLWSTVPAMLEQRFCRLRDGDQGPAWMQEFGKAWREVLLAELSVRLEPVVGLIEAMSNEVRTH